MRLNIFGYITATKEYGKSRAENIAVLITEIIATAKFPVY
jgi:hypothetical protein